MPLEIPISEEFYKKNKKELKKQIGKLTDSQLIMAALAILLEDDVISLGDKILYRELEKRSKY